MAEYRDTWLLWRGDVGSPESNESISRYGRYHFYSRVAPFATSMAAHSLCNVNYEGVILSESKTLGAPGLGADVGKKAVIYFRNPDTQKVLHFTYPAPIAADVEVTPAGKRIKESSVITIVGYLSVLSEIAYIPLYGSYYEKA